MPTFFLKYEIRPHPLNPHYAKISGGLAHIFVCCEDQDTAERLALDFLSSRNWEVVEEQEFRGPVKRESCEYNAEILALWDKAQVCGVSAEFVGGIGGGEIFN